MRLEWGHWISQHRWDFFEYQAKKNPSQQLCDTVAELEAGIEAKGEKRELKRVLYLLKQAGYQPTPHHKPAELQRWNNRPLSPRPNMRAFMSKPDAQGGNVFYFFYPKARTLHLATIGMNETARIYAHAHQWGPIGGMPVRIEFVKTHAKESGFEIREAHADYVLSRISRCWREKFEEDHVDDFTESLLELFQQTEEMRHPALDLPLRSVTDEECRTLWKQYPASARWRLYVSCEHELMGDIHSIRWDPDFTEDEKNQRLYDLLIGRRRQILDEATVRNHVQRFRDMAYLLALDGNLDSEKFAAVALEIESRGPASVYLGECLEVTARDLPNLLEKDDLESEALCWAA